MYTNRTASATRHQDTTRTPAGKSARVQRLYTGIGIRLHSARFKAGRCSKGVDPVLAYHSKLVAIDEEADHQIGHGRRLGKAQHAVHQPFNPYP